MSSIATGGAILAVGDEDEAVEKQVAAGGGVDLAGLLDDVHPCDGSGDVDVGRCALLKLTREQRRAAEIENDVVAGLGLPAFGGIRQSVQQRGGGEDGDALGMGRAGEKEGDNGEGSKHDRLMFACAASRKREPVTAHNRMGANAQREMPT